MKNTQSSKGKGFLEINWDEGKGTLTKVEKDEEKVYDFFEMLNKYNGQNITFSISVDEEQQPIED